MARDAPSSAMPPAFRRAAWFFLAYTLLVVLWGAFVRATGSGAGCGDHWPLCNGEVLPRAPAWATVVELTHRVTSGLCWFGAVALAVWAFRASPARHPVRWPAVWVVVLMSTEALIGAGVVLFEMVADNASFARAYWMVAHLMNTFLLLAALAGLVRAATVSLIPLEHGWIEFFRAACVQPGRCLLVGSAVLAILFAAAGGAVAALGDTLFPASTLAEALRADFSPTAHIFLRLRVVHPVLALLAAAVTLLVAGVSFGRGIRGGLSMGVGLLVLGEVGVGFLNVALLAPVWLQLVHLLIADLVWIGLLLLGIELLGSPETGPAAVRGPAAFVPDRQRQVG